MRVEFAVPSPSDSSTDYLLDMSGGQVPPSSTDGVQALATQPSSSQPHSIKNLRRAHTLNGMLNEEEQRNIISLRYRADSMADSVASDTKPNAETKLWNLFEQVFCFLKGMTIYQTRRRLKFTIVSQTIINSLRIFPIILGLSFQATLPVLILYVTLVLGWHGTKFLVPKFLLSYKIGMQLTLLVDVIWYYKGYNGKLNSVSSGTSVLMQGFFSILLTMLNTTGFMYGWKLRRIVKAVQNQRECDRAALATMMPSPQRVNSLHQTMSINPSAGEMDEDCGPSARRKLVVGPGVLNSRLRRSPSGVSATLPDILKSKTQRRKEAEAQEEAPVFCSNLIITSKYTYYNFLFVFLKMQFSRLANLYTTIVVALCFFDFSPVSPVASLTPLLIVFATSALKDVSEDLRRQKGDAMVNSRPAHIARRDVTDEVIHIDGTWQDIEVGDVLVLKDGDQVPADCILLATSRPDGRCYVETANLDGETNLKIRQVASCTKHFQSAEEILERHELEVECDVPNKDLFYFDGVLKLKKIGGETVAGTTNKEDLETSLTMDNLILRGSDSRNAEWTLGLVIYTGKETKVQMNSVAVPLKRSFVEKTLDTMFVLVLMLLFGISIACTLGNNNWNLDLADDATPWYIQEESNGYIFLSYVILFNNLIPLSMYVTMEGVRFVHARYIENDLEIYDTKTDTPAQVRNSNINEDLGQIQYIFSDKTGTLTCNEMIFAKCTIAGLRYNDIEVDTVKQARPGTKFNDSRLLARLNSNHSTKKEIHDFLLLLTICNTVIPETNGPMSPTTSSGSCSTQTPTIKYNASSPDEEALVLAAADLGYVLSSRDGPMCNTVIQGKPMSFEILNVLEFNSDRKRMSVIVRFPDGSIVLYCKGADDIIFDLLSKSQPQGVAHVTRGHLQEYASEGLRTLTTAVRHLTQEEYDQWNQLYRQAEFSMEGRAAKIAKVSAIIEVDLTLLGATAIEDRLQDGVEESICALRKAGIKFWVLTGDKKETALSIGMSSHVIDDNMDVIVLGQRDKGSLRTKLEELYVDLVEDKWGSDETSSAVSVLWEALRRAIMYLWDLVKLALVGRDEEAEARKKRRRVPRREHAGVDTPSDSPVHFDEVYPALPNRDISENSFDRDICDHDFEPKTEATTGGTGSMSSGDYIDEELEFAMVIDGKTLALVLDDDIKYLFLAVATQCKSVICCRCSPAQKASVVKLVTEPTLMFSPGNITLAIGDGANDVPMIQAANVGVGISGKEGRQAVLSSDYSIAEFQYLKRLLLVHGNYSYKRISKLILFSFMKNVALSLSNFFLAMETMYSGLLMYFSIFFTLYNALFTTIPIVLIAMYNQDVSPAVLMQYPTLYVNGLKNRSFNWLSFFGWCVLGTWHAYVVYAVPFFTNGSIVWYFSSDSSKLQFDKRDLGLWANGVASYTYLITASTVQVSLMTSNWTWTNAISTAGTLIFYYLFTAFFCAVFGWTKTDFYDTEVGFGVVDQLVREPWFWLGLMLSVVVAVLPNYIAKAGRVLFYPEPSHLMREWNRLAKGEDAAVMVDSPRLVRRNTGFAFSHCPGETEMALGTYRGSNTRDQSRAGQTSEVSNGGVR